MGVFKVAFLAVSGLFLLEVSTAAQDQTGPAGAGNRRRYGNAHTAANLRSA